MHSININEIGKAAFNEWYKNLFNKEWDKKYLNVHEKDAFSEVIRSELNGIITQLANEHLLTFIEYQDLTLRLVKLSHAYAYVRNVSLKEFINVSVTDE